MSVLSPAVVNSNCECPPGAAVDPSAAAIPVPITVELDNCFPKECGTCPTPIVPAAPSVPDVEPRKKCWQFDPAYCGNWVRLPMQTGLTLLTIAVDPSRGAIMNGSQYCEELCVDADPIDQYAQYSMGDNMFTWKPAAAIDNTDPQNPVEALPAATATLKFYVDPIYRNRINCELGYVILSNKNWANYWVPREVIENQYMLTLDEPFPLGNINLALDPAAALIGNEIGTAPLIEVAVHYAPTTRAVTDTTTVDTPVTTDLAASAFDVDGDLDPTTVALIDPADSTEKATVVVAGEGTWDATAADGTVTFTPATGVTGTFSIQWVVYDAQSNRSNVSSYTVTVS